MGIILTWKIHWIFENEIIEQSLKQKVSIYWNYFQRWKLHFFMEEARKKQIIVKVSITAYTVIDLFELGECNESCRFNNV